MAWFRDSLQAGDSSAALALLARSPEKLDTALREACSLPSYEFADLFLRMGANPNEGDDWNNRTAFHEACQVKHRRLIELLLDHGADPDLTDGYGSDAWDCVRGDLDLELLLIARGYRGRHTCSDGAWCARYSLRRFGMPLSIRRIYELSSPSSPAPLELGVYLDRHLPMSGEVVIMVQAPGGAKLHELVVDTRDPPPTSPFFERLATMETGTYKLDTSVIEFTGRMVVKLHFVTDHPNYEFLTQWGELVRRWPEGDPGD